LKLACLGGFESEFGAPPRFATPLWLWLLFIDDDDDLSNISNKTGVYDRLPGPPESIFGRGGEVDEYLSVVLVMVFDGGAGEEPISFVKKSRVF